MVNQSPIPGENPKPNNPTLKESGYYTKFLDELLDLKTGVDKEATINEIIDKKSMNGPNAWMLICSIVIASIGLDINSPAVIIGAMLISPLMAPILGMGLSVGINDVDGLKKSGTHFSAAVVIAIITSTLYFLVSPFGELTSEIAARTSPTFLDVFVAFFGGIAGIVSIARKDISTTLPGVAIATALMPPLCVVGFGLANGELKTASSAFYLFFLNTFFVSMATYLIIRYLRFPYKQFVNQSRKVKNRALTLLFGFLVTIPSFFIFRGVINDFRTKTAINTFKNEYLAANSKQIDDHEFIDKEKDTLILYVYGNAISPANEEEYENQLAACGLPDVELEIIPRTEVTKDWMNVLEGRVTEVESLSKQLEKAQVQLETKNKIIDSLGQVELKSISDSLTFQTFSNTIKINYPEISIIRFGQGLETNFESTNSSQFILIEWDEKPVKGQKSKVTNSFNERFGKDLRVIHISE